MQEPLPPIDNHPIRREPLVYQSEFENLRKAKNLTALDDPSLYCLLPGVPRITTMPMPLEIIQTPKLIVILYEAFRAWRRTKPYYTGAVLRPPIDVRIEEYECIENNADPEHMKKALELESPRLR